MSSSRIRPREEDISSPAKKQVIQERDARDLAARKAVEYVRPSDWPLKDAQIDLAVQDLPHASANTGMFDLNAHRSR